MNISDTILFVTLTDLDNLSGFSIEVRFLPTSVEGNPLADTVTDRPFTAFHTREPDIDISGNPAYSKETVCCVSLRMNLSCTQAYYEIRLWIICNLRYVSVSDMCEGCRWQQVWIQSYVFE